MARPGFADRNKLRDWANVRRAQAEFPRLVRRLILETMPGLTELGMPAGEGVAAGRWDGTARSTSSNPWVPAGLSVWELSVTDRPGAKADEDYSKRDSTPDNSPTQDCTYIEAILRPWTKRQEWSAARNAEGKWREVRAYGLDDIEAWLETAPVTWAWFSEELGLGPYGMQTAETRWKGWSSQTSPALTPDIVLAGREKAVDAINGLLAGSGVATLGGASLDEACAFLAAMAIANDAAGDGNLLARLAFVDDRSTWRLLLDSAPSLVLVPMQPDFAHELPADTDHTVLVPVTNAAVADVELLPLDASRVRAALAAAGMNEREADEAGRLARRSLMALRRNIAVKSALHVPSWAEPPVPRHVRAALLAGSWEDQRDGDKRVLGDLSGGGYDDFRERASELALEADPFLVHVGGSWHLVAPFDAWLLLVARLTEDDLRRFEVAVATVIGELDPALELPQEDRWWKASFEGKVRAFSADVRRGLARSLALLGVHGNAVAFTGGTSGSGWAAYLVQRLLEEANEDATGSAWASLSDVLPLLAEAAPDAVVDAMTIGTTGAEPVLAKLFTDRQDAGPLFSSNSAHTSLLWALETLAWSPDHFGAAVDLLARLDALDPGGRLSNRPFNSLVEIFCPWHPETSASPERRLRVIDQARRRHAGVAWRLLLSMLPEPHATHFPTNAPVYRDWRPADLGVTRSDYLAFVSDVVARCIEDAGDSGSRWKDLLEKYADLPPRDRDAVMAALSRIVDSESLTEDDATQIWEAVRGVVGRHREFADASWALQENQLRSLEAIVDRLRPESAYRRHEWLFQDWMPHVGDPVRRDDHDAYEALVAERRRDAVADIESEGGLEAVRRLAADVEVRWSVGVALADARPTYDDALFELLGGDDAVGVDLASSYFSRRFISEGWAWLEAVLVRHPGASAPQRARMLLVARDFPRAWHLAAEYGSAVAERYWQLFVPYGLGPDFDYVEVVAEHLMSVGRNAMAVDFLHLYMSRKTLEDEQAARLIADGLEGVLRTPDDPEIGRLSGFDFEESMQLLEQYRGSIGVDRVARLEWGLLPALGHDPDAPALHEAMAENPSFFVEAVCAAYASRAADAEEREEGDEAQDHARALNAYRLLSSWHNPPGLADGVIDADLLHEWLDGVVVLLRERGRLEVGLVHVGQVLVSAPPDSGGEWPPRVVRDLLEAVQSKEIESGLYTEVLNRRGVTSRPPEEGGDQEAVLAKAYRADADRLADEWPRTAAILRRIAKSYEADARREELSAERLRRGLE